MAELTLEQIAAGYAIAPRVFAASNDIMPSVPPMAVSALLAIANTLNSVRTGLPDGHSPAEYAAILGYVLREMVEREEVQL